MANTGITARLRELGEQAAQQEFRARHRETTPRMSPTWFHRYFSEHPLRALITGFAIGATLAAILRCGTCGHES